MNIDSKTKMYDMILYANASNKGFELNNQST